MVFYALGKDQQGFFLILNAPVLPDQSADLACSDLKGYIVDRVGDAEALINVFGHQ